MGELQSLRSEKGAVLQPGTWSAGSRGSSGRRDIHATYVINSDDIILDTGCRTAVAGEEWHHRFQQMLDAKGLRYETVEHEEIFRFGAEACAKHGGCGVPSAVRGRWTVVLPALGSCATDSR